MYSQWEVCQSATSRKYSTNPVLPRTSNDKRGQEVRSARNVRSGKANAGTTRYAAGFGLDIERIVNMN